MESFFCPHCFQKFTSMMESRLHQGEAHPEHFPVILAGDPMDDQSEALKLALDFPSTLEPMNNEELQVCISAVATLAQIFVANGFATAEQAEAWGRANIESLVDRMARYAAYNQLPPEVKSDKDLLTQTLDYAAGAATKFLENAFGTTGMTILKAPGQLAMLLAPDYYAKDPGAVAALSNPIGTAIYAARKSAEAIITQGPEALKSILSQAFGIGPSKLESTSPEYQAEYAKMLAKGTSSDGLKALAKQQTIDMQKKAGTYIEPDSEKYKRSAEELAETERNYQAAIASGWKPPKPTEAAKAAIVAKVNNRFKDKSKGTVAD